jgi:hypothetical protein
MGKGIVKLGEGNWAVKDGNLLAAKETNSRFKNAEFTVTRGSDATYVGRDGLIKNTSSNIESEVFINPNFDTTIPLGISGSGWSDSGSGEVAFYNGGLKMTGEGAGTTKARARDASHSYSILKTSRLYELTYEIKSISSKNNTLSLYMAGNTHIITQKSVGTHTILVASGTDANKIFQFQWYQTDNESIVLGNVSLKESLVVNGSFDADSDWNTGSGDWTISGGSASTTNGNNNLHTSNPVASTTGLLYKVTFTLQNVSQGYVTVGLSSLTSTQFNSNGTYTIYIESDGNRYLYFKPYGFTGSIDNVSIFKIDNGALPRIDFTDNTDGHLLLEPQSTNLITYSEDFSEWTFLGNTNINATNITSPSGENNATNITGLNGSGTNDLRKQLTYNTANKTLTFSVYLKGSGTLRFQMSNGIDQAFQNVITLTNQWQRYNVSGTFNSTSVSIFYLVIDDHSGLTATSYDVWGAQVEELSYATSYIPTNGSTVTRDAETCKDAGEAADFSSEGVLYAEIAALANSGTWREINLDDGSTNNAVEIRYKTTANQFQFVVRNGGTAVVSPTVTISNPTEFMKVAFSYKTDDCKMYINGVEVATDTSGTMPSGLNNLSFDWGGTNPFHGKCKAIRVYKEALSDSELVTLTSL